ncbi:MAG: flavodoxin [Ruminococcaceae bacterium]|nr:flavodoxin [Oscillospiraceae bacterium]
MNKTAIVYWSGTGNTEEMAKAVLKGARSKGASAEMISASVFAPDLLDKLDTVAFGCPAMGSEVLEEEEFEPMFSSCLSSLAGKKIALFGSYGWGDGEWMRNWEESCKNAGAVLLCDSVICTDEPDEEAIAACNALGEALA